MLGIAASSSASISSEFDAFKATRITVSTTSVREFERYISDSGLVRTEQINGVVAAGASLSVGERSLPVELARGLEPIDVPVVAARGDLLSAERATIIHGRFFDAGNASRGDQVAVVGNILAKRLGLQDVGNQVLFIDGRPFEVIGVVSSPDLTSALPFSLFLPSTSARAAGWGDLFQPPTVVVRTTAGAAESVGAQVEVALDPRQQADLDVAVPPRPQRLQTAVERQTRVQLLALATVSLIVGAIGVSNTTLVGVMERRHEIGVRKAVGASTTNVVLQFLIESLFLGAAGGLGGEFVGLVVSLTASVLNGWEPVVPAWLFFAGPIIGGGVGLVAGAYPAFRASRVDPIVALS